MTREYKETGMLTFIGETTPVGDSYHKLIFTITNDSGYNGKEKLFAFEIFEKTEGDKIANFLKFNQVGQIVDVSFEPNCNEHNGRFFTSLSAWKVFKAEGQTSASAQTHDEALDESPPF